jgi:hypothetical protein
MSDKKGHPDDRAHEADVPHENPLVAHEPTDVDVRAIIKWGVGLGVFTIAAVLFVWFVFDQLAGLQARESPPASPLVDVRETPQPPEPRLQPTPRLDVKQMREKEEQALGGYAWTDQQRGRARIPAEAAMKIMVEKGFPVRTQPADAATATQRTLPADSSSGRTFERRAQ